MKLLFIVSLGVFAVCSGMPEKSYGLIGMPLMMEDKLNCRTIDPNELSSTFLFVDPKNVSRLVGSSGNYTLSDIEIQNSTNIYKDYNINGDFTYNCVENTAYILKKMNESSRRVLNVFDYNKSNGVLVLKRQIPDMFFDAHDIQSDWVTGNIYWVTRYNGIHYSIKVTDKSFNKPENVIDSLDKEIHKLRVYGEKSEIFFVSETQIYYTSTSVNSTANLLFSSPINIKNRDNLVIDHETDQLCWSNFIVSGTSIIRCIELFSSSRPLNVKDIVDFKKTSHSLMFNLIAFSNQFYWIGFHNDYHDDVLFSMDGNKTVVEVGNLHYRNNFLNFVLLNCPCTGNDYMELVATSKLKTLQKLKKVAHGLEQVEDPIKIVTVVKGEERKILGKDAGIIYDN